MLSSDETHPNRYLIAEMEFQMLGSEPIEDAQTCDALTLSYAASCILLTS